MFWLKTSGMTRMKASEMWKDYLSLCSLSLSLSRCLFLFLSVSLYLSRSYCICPAHDLVNKRDRNKDFTVVRDRERDTDRERVCDRDRKYILTHRPSNQYNIELNKQIMGNLDTKELCDFISTHSAGVESCQCGHFLSQNTSSFRTAYTWHST